MRVPNAVFLTVGKARPYPLEAVRLKAFPIFAAAVCLCGCATNDTALRQEVATLRTDVQALQLQNTQLTQRVQQLEDQRALLAPSADAATAAPTPSPAPAAKDDGTLQTPPLTVIKLKPATRPAPKLDTEVAVIEPSTDQLSALPDAASGPPDNSEMEYQKAMEDLRTGNLAHGVNRLEEFAQAHRKSELADNALYFAGVGRIGLEDFEGAGHDFAQVIDHYPAGDAVADAMLKLAECRLKLNHEKDARALLARVVSTFPGTAAASQAERRLAALSP